MPSNLSPQEEGVRQWKEQLSRKTNRILDQVLPRLEELNGMYAAARKKGDVYKAGELNERLEKAFGGKGEEEDLKDLSGNGEKEQNGE